ncbi:50S ribosomal protein L15 [Myxococcota bacterium]|nr:50S ribosomal protein L15 [Myxococcota bacterium]MBU1382613.1 50S ribosomal protein L15 [Myxococcota bacterium]MBU1495830.1 50S ribosomal protein L15 [Myxococcota bacterium]
MSILSNLKPNEGSVKNRKRLGRGRASGQGSTSGKGCKGQKQRTGGKIRPGFEGGQMPLQRRVPKRGFNNNFRKEYCLLTLEELTRIMPEGGKVNLEVLRENGYAGNDATMLKVLGTKEISGKYEITADKVTEAAWKIIEEKGGSVNLVSSTNEYATVTLGQITRKFPKKGDSAVDVTFDAMKSAGLVPEGKTKVAVVAVGKLNGKYNISVHKISREARKALEMKDGKVTVIDPVNNYRIVDFRDLEKWFPKGGEVTVAALTKMGILNASQKVKLSGDGRVKAPYSVQVHKASAIARRKLESFGGKITLID